MDESYQSQLCNRLDSVPGPMQSTVFSAQKALADKSFLSSKEHKIGTIIIPLILSHCILDIQGLFI